MFQIELFSVSGITIALFTSLLILSREKRKPFDYLLVGWLLATGFNLSFFLWNSQSVASLPFMANLLGISMPLMHGPLLFLFVKHAFSEKVGIREVKHFIPWLVFMMVFIVWWIRFPDGLIFRHGFMGFVGKVPWILEQYGLFFAIIAGGYTLAAFLRIQKLKRQLEKTHSSEVRNIFNWLQRWIFIALVFFLATYLVVEITLSTEKISSPDTFKIISVFISVYISYIGYYGIRQPNTFQMVDLEPLAVEKEFNVNNEADKLKIQKAIEKLNEVFETQQPFLDPDLTITGLSNLCGIPSGQISLAINRGAGKNFYDFINEYRVKEFIVRIDDKEYAYLSLLGLAYDCGFRSKSTFNAFFKRHTGFTPSQYKKNLSNKSGKI